jgi:DNA-binding transcriptional MerR regulator
MTIGQVAKAAGVSASMIRFYESSGLLPQPRRKNGIREYDASTIEQLRILRFFRASGVSIESLTLMAAADQTRRKKNRHEVVLQRIAELDGVIKEARAMKRRLLSLLDCECGGDPRKCVIFR